MKIYTEILGNIRDPQWAGKVRASRTEYLDLDQWTAQKSRFVVRSDRGSEYAVALERHSRLTDGDIVDYDPREGRIVVLRVRLSDVMVVDLGRLADRDPEAIIRIAVELGHAIGNQHWPAVVKGTRVDGPLTVDRTVMESVMRTHRIECAECSCQPGSDIIPYLAPHEVRRLFGGAEHDAAQHLHPHSHAHVR